MTLAWFNVKDYGAVANGVTDDTSAVSSAITALVAAGRGVLYFPAGTYKTSGGFTLSVPTYILGDGMGSWDQTYYVTKITCTSQTASLFTVSAGFAAFGGLSLENTYAGTASAGAAVTSSPTTGLERIDLESVAVKGFYDGLDLQGTGWTVRNSWVYGPVRYGIRIRNTVIADAGDWAISDSMIVSAIQDATSGIRIESSGGGKISNTKVNMALDSKRFATGIDVSIATGIATSILMVSGCSVENVSGDAVNVTTTGTGSYPMVTIAGLQCGLYTNNTGRAVNLNAASAGKIAYCTVSSLTATTDGTARAAIALTNTDNVKIGPQALRGNFNATYTGSGDTNTTVLT